MTEENREFCRKVSKFLTTAVTKKGSREFGNVKFSFRNLVIVERDDRIRAECKKSITKIAADEKLSRNQVYKVRSRK